MVGKQGLEPRLPGPRPGALTLTPHPGRDPRSRTAFLLNPNQADYRLPRSRDVLRHPGAARWRRRESNPLRRRLRGVPATLAVIPVELARLERAGLLHAMQALYRLSYSPMVRCGARYSQSPGVAGLSSAASPRSGRHGGPAGNGAHAMDVSTSMHVHRRVVRAGIAGVEPAFRSGWSRVAYPLADPQINENRPGISLGRLLSSA